MKSFHNFKTCLLFYIFLVLPITVAQPLSFNVTNFNDTQTASLVGYAGVAKSENRSIVLNSLTDNGIGRAIYGLPLRFKNSSNRHVTDFSTRFSFTIDVSSKTDYGDGFAFFVAPLAYPIPSDSGGGGLGLYGANQDSIIAVEFDTFPNANVDPQMRHVGINNNSLVSLNSSFFDIESNIGNMGHALITYNSSAKFLAVSWFFEGTSSGFMPNTSLSYQIDLGEILPEWVTVGFSGATGASNEENVIHSWEFTSTLNSTPLNNKEKDGNNDIIVKYKFSVQVVAVAVSCSVLFMLVVAAVSWFIIIKKRRSEDGFGFNGAAMPRRFGYKELVAATNGFADDRRLGEGGTGQVYKGRTLTWGVRYNIALGVARALCYLHEEVEQASKESDMYGFGVVALEIGCGRRTYQDGEYNHVPLTNWVWKKYVDGDILDAVDEGLKGDYDVEEMRCLLTVGIWCTHPDHRQRPKAEQVINALKQETPLPMLSL
ncbi:L-type lectin-domain containing receptor [Vigna angularis]|uniref:non-specific serine/threonine protein kinase n=1 Tax=Phaseolus angularis TaxID=3914 RepID=A0A8T0K1X6_PHAAN|nr:L-type lectin-domain containing receptor [Vigna angularis]